ncbi:MAG TPA: hypothetical protein HA283_04515 [Nanoarchaeota archaeon]|nr:hypothetical protein [Nanoarchaeota archaeon]HIH63532.1 hypothetical protein [Nanoarchaeota archaeon]HIJ09461.1 hypothetical protein [Nanoarchaeota archaeon]
MVQKFVFSDETGHWNEGECYIRSWIIVSEDDYLMLKNKMNLCKKINNVKGEIKFGEGHDYSLFEDLNFNAYFTLTFCNDFKSRNFNLINQINSQDISSLTINNRNIKEKILNTLKNSLFLNIYEFFHIKNTILFLQNKYPSENFIFFIDSPQCQNNDWKDIFQEVYSEFKLKIINRSEDEIGIQFADILAGNVKKILRNIDSYLSGSKILNNFDKKIISNFSQSNGGSSAFLNNPQIVMWKPEHQSFVDKIITLKESHNE